MTGSELADALAAFDRVEVTLSRLELVWAELASLTPSGTTGPADPARYAELSRAFDDLVNGLPPIDGWRISDRPMSPNDIIQNRIDAHDVGEVGAFLQVEEAIEAPGEAVAEYRHRFRGQRRLLVRRRADELVSRIDLLLPQLTARYERGPESLAEDSEWQNLVDAWRELQRLLGPDALADTRVGDLNRHVRFGLAGDLHDIADHDWPSVRPAVERSLYTETEPLPVDIPDLATVVQAEPTGAVPTALDFSGLVDEDFERLIFALLSTTPGYENPKWLMETRAPDRGRDLSVDQVSNDPLTGTRRLRVIVQCKAWQRSIGATECQAALAPMTLWEPPKVDLLIVATTGRFSEQGVQWIEKHNHEGKSPRIEMWPNSHLELLLASRGDLVAEFGLRPTT
jgi:hypothetical protein